MVDYYVNDTQHTLIFLPKIGVNAGGKPSFNPPVLSLHILLSNDTEINLNSKCKRPPVHTKICPSKNNTIRLA